MKDKDVIEGNRLIAEFMGGKLDKFNITHKEHYRNLPHGRTILIENLQYHSSWDWLMPVVEKIEKIKGVHFVISELGCDIYHFGKKVADAREDTKISTIRQAIIQFIQWYNAQTKQQQQSPHPTK